MIIKKIYLFCLLLIILGCSSTPIHENESNLTTTIIQKTVIKNCTTQHEILEIFGSPNQVTKNNLNEDVWKYYDVNIDSPGFNTFSTVLIVGKTRGGNKNHSNNIDYPEWIITFNSNEVVKNYSIGNNLF